MAAYMQEQQQQRWLPLRLQHCCACAEPSSEMQLLECLHWFCSTCLHLPDVKGVSARSPDHGSDCRSAVAAQAHRCSLCAESVALLASVTLGNLISSTSVSNASGDRHTCDVPSCGPCAEAADACGKAAAAPSVASCRCSTCNVFLCDSCSRRHERFAPTHRDSVTMLQPLSCSSPANFTVATRRPNDNALPNLIAPGIGAHSCTCSLFCLDCHRPACPAAGCLSACVDARHRLAAVDGERVRAATSNAAQKLLASRNAASGTVNLLLARRRSSSSYVERPLPPSQTPPDGGRAEAAVLLGKNRQSALEVLRTVLERAAMRTKAVYDAAHGSGRGSHSFQCELAGAARMADAAKRYGILLATGGSSRSGEVHVLQQQCLVLWRVRSLTARIEHLSRLVPSTKIPLAVHKMLSICKDSDSLPKIVASWIGTPCIAGDQAVSKMAIAPCASTARPTSTTAADGRDNGDHAAAPAPRSLRFGPMRSSFVTKCPWRDVTVSADGCVLVAALQDGMCEYSCRGELIGSWRPPPELGTSVYTLRALSDGRVVVGVFFSHCVVVLRRAAKADSGESSAQWQVDRRVAVRALPQHVATLGSHLIAVAGTRTQDHGYELDVVRLGGGSNSCSGDSTVLARTLDFVVILTALTSRAIVVSTGKKRRLDGSCGPAVEAYNYSWTRLWQLSLASDVMDVWPQPFGHVITLGVGRERKMMAVDASNGCVVDDQAARIGASLPASKPCSDGMAAYYDGRRALLAVALPAESANRATVEWYPSIIGSA